MNSKEAIPYASINPYTYVHNMTVLFNIYACIRPAHDGFAYIMNTNKLIYVVLITII